MKTHFNIWIAESYSCQIDILQLLKKSPFSSLLTIFCSHTHLRPELRQTADVFMQQPCLKDSADWLLSQCKTHHIDLLFCGKHGERFEHLRAQFEACNIQLVTGAMSEAAHALINNKFLFTQQCQKLNLAAIPALQVTSVESLQTAITLYKNLYPKICAKPVHGVYASGFVQLIDDISYFRHIQHPTHCNTQQFIEAYAQLDTPIPYLIMPFLIGQECSVDIACHQGQVIDLVTRVKCNFYQECYTEHPCHDLAKALVNAFACDGLINIQFKQDDQQRWHILEINPRPAGGFAYTQHTGINLIAALIAYKLKLDFSHHVGKTITHVVPLTRSIMMETAT